MKSLSKKYLDPLVDYLVESGKIPDRVDPEKIRISHSPRADRNNSKSDRSFCFVFLGERAIHCAKAIELLPDEFIVGILLHEIAHMIVEKQKGDPELLVDEWVTENIPESGYHYSDVKYFDYDGERNAKNLECVTKQFLKTIGV